jgi:hypothetical protein
MWTALSLFFFRRWRNCAIWISSTRTNYKPPLLRWHLTASAGKCAVKTTRKVEFGVMVCSPWQCTCSLCSLCEILGKDKLSCHTVLTRFSAAWLSFPRTQDGVTGTDNLMISLTSQPNRRTHWPSVILCTSRTASTGGKYQVSRRLVWRGQHLLEGKNWIYSCQHHEGMQGHRCVLFLYWTSTLNRGERSTSCPGPFASRKRTLVPIE